MPIRCPGCSAPRYAAGEMAGGLSRCARCGTPWFARPIDEAAYGRAITATRQPLIIEGDAVRVPPARRSSPRAPRAPAVHPPAADSRAAPHPRRFAAVAAAGLVALCALAVPVAGAIPGIAGLFAPADGIVLADVASRTMTLDGERAILVEGRLANPTGHSLPVPQVRIALRAAGGGEAYAWTVEPSEVILAPHAAIGFRSARTNPAPDTDTIAVSLAPRAQEIGMR